MRRLFLYGLAALESAVAAALVVIALQLPSRDEVSANFTRVAKVTDGAEKQVHVMRDQVGDLRDQDLPGKADQLRRHTRTAADTAGRAQIDFRTVEAIAKSLADVSKGLDTWADTVDAERMKRVSTGLGEAAGYLDDGVAGPSQKSAAELEKVLAGLEKDSNRLATLLRQSPPDLKAARTIYDGLGSLDNGLDKLGDLLKPDRVDAMKEGLVGLEGSLTSTAAEVDKVSALSYPVVTLNGLRPNVETKPFWPDGEKVADGLRKATKGVQAANKELDAMGKSLPEVQKALADSRKSAAATRESLGKAIRHQEETERLLKSVPEQTAALAEALPRTGKALTQMLRETQRLRDLAIGLRAVRKTLDDTLVHWPEVARGLKKSAAVLDHARAQLDAAAANRDEYEKAMESSSQVARSLADMLPAFTDQFDSRLGEQEASLGQMEAGLSEVNESLPVIESKTTDLVRTVKWLLYLVAGLVALHAGYVLLDSARGFATSAKPQAADSVT